VGLTIVQVDSFTNELFAGNPACVCLLNEPADSSWMQDVAREMNVSETAFLARRPAGEFALRWFTPVVEVELCGHATLASAHMLWEEGHLPRTDQARFHTQSGLLTAQVRDSWIDMDFPIEAATLAPTPPGLVEAIGAEPRYVGQNRFDYLVELDNETTVRGLRPDVRRLEELLSARGVIVTSRGETDTFDFVSRFFAPAVGIDEDPVTGSSHCCLGPYWASRLGKDRLTAYQASARGGVVGVRVDGDRVVLSGQAVTVFRAELTRA